MVDIECLDHVGTMELAGHLGFIAKKPEEAGILAEVSGNELEGAGTAEKNVLGEIDYAHAALAELAHDAVFPTHHVAGRKLMRLDQHSSTMGQVMCWSGYGVS